MKKNQKNQKKKVNIECILMSLKRDQKNAIVALLHQLFQQEHGHKDLDVRMMWYNDGGMIDLARTIDAMPTYR